VSGIRFNVLQMSDLAANLGKCLQTSNCGWHTTTATGDRDACDGRSF